MFTGVNDVDPAGNNGDRLAVLDCGVVNGCIDPPRQSGGQAETLGAKALRKRSGERLAVG